MSPDCCPVCLMQSLFESDNIYQCANCHYKTDDSTTTNGMDQPDDNVWLELSKRLTESRVRQKVASRGFKITDRRRVKASGWIRNNRRKKTASLKQIGKIKKRYVKSPEFHIFESSMELKKW